MTRGELIDALCAQDRIPSAENARLVRELELHQIELENQNRDLREAQEQLDDSRRRYVDLFECAPVGYCVFARNGTIEDANGAAANLLRTNRAALVGIPFSRAVTIVEKQTFADHLARCLDEQIRVTSELTVVVRGRGEMVLEVVSTPLVHVGARTASCRTMLHDITRLKRSESVLMFITSVDESLASATDAKATLETMTSACVPMLGDACFVDLCDGEDTRIRRALVHAPGRADVAELLRRQVFDSAWRRYEAQLVRTLTPVFEPASGAALGPSFEAQMGARGLLLLPLSARGRTLGVLGAVMAQSGRTYSLHDFELAQDLAHRFAMALANAVAHDVSKEALRARDEILSIVSSDLSRHLAEIVGSTQTLVDDDARRAVRHAIGRMERVVSNLVELATLDAGELSVSTEPHDVCDLVASAVAGVTAAAREHSVSIAIEAGPGLVASCDRQRIAQVLETLVEAAVKVTRPGGAVRVVSERIGTIIRTSVSDGGPPIEEELLQWAFDPTWQKRVEDTERDVVGLGLYVAKGIVEAQEGTIGATSDASGATFFFTLPAESTKRTETKRAIPIPRPSQPKPAVFLVDTDGVSRRSLRDELQRHGYAVIELDDVLAATGQVRSAPSLPAAMIVDDTALALEPGRAALTELRNDPALAPMPLIVTAEKDHISEHARALGASVLLEKPIALDRLLATLDD